MNPSSTRLDDILNGLLIAATAVLLIVGSVDLPKRASVSTAAATAPSASSASKTVLVQAPTPLLR